MATETPTASSEPRALSAALAAPAFTPRSGGIAMHAASRHVERWAPETDAARGRSMRSLGFVDRLVAPWIETAQRSAGLRMFSQYIGGAPGSGFAEREGAAVSWVFPRPWYQDELDWMTAARMAARQTASGGGEQPRAAQPAMLTTRGTYVPPARSLSVPSALYEYVAPSLSVARGPMPVSTAFGGVENVPSAAMARSLSTMMSMSSGMMSRDAYSPLVPLAAVQAAQLVSRTMAQLTAPTIAPSFSTPATRVNAPQTMAPALRSVLATMLARAATQQPSTEAATTRWALSAPELVTPPAPRPEARVDAASEAGGAMGSTADATTPIIASAQTYAAERMATQLAEQRVRVAELQRAAQQAIAREIVARGEQPSVRGEAAVAQRAQIEAARAQVEAAQQRAIAQRAADTAQTQSARTAEAQQAQQAQRADDATRVAQTEVQRVQLEAARVEQQAQQARIEERVAQRIAERTGTQRLHEQARVAAANDARATETPAPTAASTLASPAERAAVAALAAAMSGPLAALAPELAAIVGARPERAAQVIGQLSEALHAAELMSRATASGQVFEATRGPRLTMPAGLGGLVATVDRAHAVAPGVTVGSPIGMSRAAIASPAAASAPRGRDDLRVPAMSWVTAGPGAQHAPTSALAATAATSPTALQHVAWADRWLARFAGAAPSSLATLDHASTMSPHVLGIAASAPGAVFVAPTFDAPAGSAAAAAAATATSTATSAAALAEPASAPVLMRFDDTQETPDDVFAAISQSASQTRGAAASARAASTPAAIAAAAAAAAAPQLTPPPVALDRGSYADAIAHAVPSAPNAGLSAQLASSPFAPALRHMLPMPAAASFDVRALFGGALSATYLAGLLGSSAREIANVPAGLPWSPIVGDAASASAQPLATRDAPAWDATYVSPELPPARAPGDDAPAFDASEPASAAPSSAAPSSAATARALQQQQIQALPALTTLRSALLAFDVELPAHAHAATTPAAAFSSGPMAAASPARALVDGMAMPMLGDSHAGSAPGESAMWAVPGMVADRAHSWSVAQERSAADLSFDFVTPELVLAARVYGLGPIEAAQAARLAIAGPGQLTAMAGTVDRTFVQAMAADNERRDARARAVSAYPIDTAAALGSPAQVQAQLRQQQQASARADLAAPSAAFAPSATTTEPASLSPFAPMLDTPAQTSFGVERRTPRGAFLWPSATVAALNLNAAAPDGQLSMSVAALELLAAQAVAEIGTYAAFSDDRPTARDAAARAQSQSETATAQDADADGNLVATPLATVRAAAAAALRAAPELSAVATTSPAQPAFEPGSAGGAQSEPSERDVLAGATSLVSSSRRARFEAMYVALGQAQSTKTLSPAARAARALALANRGDDAPTSTRERAAAAWEVLPIIYAMGDAAPSKTIETGVVAAREHAARVAAQSYQGSLSPLVGRAGSPGSATAATSARASAAPGTASFADPGDPSSYGAMTVDSRPGLSALSARAGEALASYVAPSVIHPQAASSSSSSSSSSRESGAVLRAPTAAQEMVRTGRPSSGRFGGGEVEIPTWFENAARKMFEDKGNISDGISLAELTLVTSAPQSHIAASTRSAPSAAPSAPSPDTGGPITPSFDIDKIAHEVYRQILVLMDNARARNGEPFL